MNMTQSRTSSAQMPLPKLLLQEWRSSAPAVLKELTYQVWHGQSSSEVWLLGRNEATEILLDQGLTVDGVIDDYCTETEWHGKPIQRFEQVAMRSAVVINCVQCNNPAKAALMLDEAPSITSLSFSDFFRCSLLSKDLLPVFSRRTHEILSDVPTLFDSLWSSFSDEISRQTFADIVSFRLTTDPWFLRNYSYRPTEQYFEDFLNLPASPVLIDAGAFQGETSIEFAQRYPGYDRIYAFEPSTSNAVILLQETSTVRNLELHRVGLSDASETVRFASQKGSASCVCDDGDLEISLICLDELKLRHADLIKMDLEGGEYKALLGGSETIKRCQSSLAIASYHDPEDFAKLYQLITEILPNCSFYLRHYTSGWAETILYGIPG